MLAEIVEYLGRALLVVGHLVPGQSIASSRLPNSSSETDLGWGELPLPVMARLPVVWLCKGGCGSWRAQLDALALQASAA